MVLDPADQVCRTVTFVLLVVIEDEYEQIDGSALHHEYMDLIWACQCLTMPAMLQTSITPAHKHTLLVSEDPRELPLPLIYCISMVCHATGFVQN